MRASILTSLISLALLFPSFVFGTCAELSSLFPGRVLLPGNSTYAASVSSYFFLNERQAPACIVTPTSANEVAEIVKSINSRTAGQVAIRSGGHSPNRGFSNIDHGITIDLRGLNHMETYGKDNGILSVGTGALWIDVYKFLSPLKRVAVGSRVASVGIGGFVTGGGISFFSPQHGFACDNVRNMQVVLANGTIINANATSHSLLFRALKGGQNNFGIVTRFDLVTHPQHKYWGGAIQYPESADATQLSAFTAFKEGPYDPFSEIEQTFVYVGLQKVFSSTNNLFYTKDGVNTSNLRQFTDIQPQIVNTARISESSDFAAELEAFQPMNQFATYSTISFPISGGVLSKVHSLWRSATLSIASCHPNITSVLTFQSIPPPPAMNAPQNSLPFAPNSNPHEDIVLTLFSFYWPKAAHSKAIESGVKRLMDSVEQVVSDSVKFKYLNYAAAWQDPFKGYGRVRTKEMRDVSKIYDPEGFFQRVVTGGFKLYK